eukprot:CAMPEP_0197848934 /NCGR_PEP_ID=MMETSP1438-20131217/10547_1 /TAXON_ID=1461541 /ORGANISM="Pterosperma sp., Strain CCMP1384" /LENGTH=76 /DNA_ID=CAMNT_0043461415 /DNA_START=374 /DNA_END=604 /DNA_ORIENTATION=+
MKLKADITRMKALLDAKQAEYEEVDLAVDGDRREEMVNVSGQKVLPQLHIDGKAYCDIDILQEMEDDGALSSALGL